MVFVGAFLTLGLVAVFTVSFVCFHTHAPSAERQRKDREKKRRDAASGRMGAPEAVGNGMKRERRDGSEKPPRFTRWMLFFSPLVIIGEAVLMILNGWRIDIAVTFFVAGYAGCAYYWLVARILFGVLDRVEA